MPNDVVRSPADAQSASLSDADVDAFVGSLSAVGYSLITIRPKRQVAASFAEWTRLNQIPAADLNELHASTFLTETSRRSKPRNAVKRTTLRLFLKHLRSAGEVPSPSVSSESSPVAVLRERFESHLRRARGLSEHSVQTYRPFIEAFLAERSTSTDTEFAADLGPQDVRDFLLKHIPNQPTNSSKIMATALRSFLRFLFQNGETAVDLSLAVPTVRQWRQATVHTFLLPEEVERVLRACEQTTAVGRRDRAVLLLLARLGLRAGEVVALELRDIQWRMGEILIRGKGRILERLPLPGDVGEALAGYLHQDRGQSVSRKVFLRMRAPRVGLTTQTAVGAIARRAIARAELCPSRRGAHLFRHTLATTMIRRGASMAQIGEVLRHRSPETTEIYAKVDFETLRAVALPWPGIGGGR